MVVSADAACTAFLGPADHDRRDVLRHRRHGRRRHLPGRLGRAAARLDAAGRPPARPRLVARRLPRRDAADHCSRASPPTRCARSWPSPESVAVPEQISETAVHGQPWVGGACAATRAGWDERDAGPLQLRLVPRPRGAAEGDEGAPAADDRRPRHAGDVRRDRRERGRRQLRRRRLPDRRPGRPVTDTTAPLVQQRPRCCRREPVHRPRPGHRPRPASAGSSSACAPPAASGCWPCRGKGKAFVASLPRREHELLVIATDTQRQRVEAVPADADDGGQARPRAAPARHRRDAREGGRLPVHRRADRPRRRPGRRPVLHRLADRADAVPDGGALRRRHPRVRLGRAVRADRAVGHRRPADPGHQPVVEPGLLGRAARRRRRARAPRPRRARRWRRSR